jgi:hypothetical protein
MPMTKTGSFERHTSHGEGGKGKTKRSTDSSTVIFFITANPYIIATTVPHIHRFLAVTHASEPSHASAKLGHKHVASPTFIN